MRRTVSTVAGVFITFALLSLAEVVASSLYPVPDIMVADAETVRGIVAHLPLMPKLIRVAAWLLASLAGAWIALRIGDWRPGGWIVTGLFLASNVANQVVLPHPAWMQVCSVALPLLGGWLAQRLHAKPYPGEPLLG